MKTRRQFLKISAMSVGSLALAGGGLRLAKGNSPITKFFSQLPSGHRIAERTPTYCEICFWQCAGWVYHHEDGSIKKITGNEDDTHCNGRLCPRGTGGVGMYYDNDRLKTPLIRTSERGKQSFREASWDEAFDFIAKKMKKIASEHGPESIALFKHGSSGKYFTTLLRAFGSNNTAAPSFAQCKGPREIAFLATFGTELHSPEPLDIRDTKCMVLIGSHLGENMHNSQVQEMSDAIDKGAVIITVDPRFSTAAGKSKYWLPIKPATDLALLLSWIHVLIKEEWYDKKFVEKYCNGFEELKAHVQSFTPEWAYGITTIAPDVIRRTAKEMFNASPAVLVHPGRHVTWYGDDTQRIRAVAILNALLGSWGRRGGFFFPDSVALPEFPLPEFPKPAWEWSALADGKFAFANTGVSNVLVDASIPKPGRDKNIKAWLVVGTNLITTLPDKKQTLQAIQNLDLLVAVDTMPMEITGWADVILPECTYLERYDDIRVAEQREPLIALRMPAAEPQNNTKPAWWMAKKLAGKLGLEAYFPFKTIEEELDWKLKQMGTSLKEMQTLGVKKYPRQNGDLYIPDGSDYKFDTSSGKIELYSNDFLAAGFDPLPVYVPHPEPPEGFYRLNYGRAPMHTFSRTANNPNLTDLMDENALWVNPKVATEWGLKKDQKVYLQNQDGVVSSFSIKIRITERIRWDSVYMVHGFGHSEKKLSRAYGRGASDSELITKVMTDPIMGGTGMRGNFVTFKLDKKETIS
jgi:thiosulfate reductase/polysulfide reductase chain A